MLKALAAAIAVFSAPQAAAADSLLTGAIRDALGAPVAGARVTALDADGRSVGTDVALADGTFAVDASRAPARVRIDCDFCRSLQVAVRPGEPVVAIVERYAALTGRGPAAADVRALPYRSADEVASLEPFTVVDAGRIADRGLARYAAVAVDDLPFYDAADGGSADALLPAHAVAALAVGSPLNAPAAGGYASAGAYDFALRDPDTPTSRFDAGDAADVVLRAQGPGAGAAYAASTDPGNDRQAAAADAEVGFGGGRLAFHALDIGASSGAASGVGLAYATDSRRYSTAGSFSATRLAGSSSIVIDAVVGNHGPFGLRYGVRALRATAGVAGGAGVQSDTAVYAGADRSSAAGRLRADVAFETGGDAGVAGGARGGAVVGSLADDLALGSAWSLHLGAGSSVRVPTFAEVSAGAPFPAAIDRSALFEQSLTYSDRRRLRLTATAFTQRVTGPAAGSTGGLGIDADWQLAPRIALRSWLLAARQSAAGAVPSAYDAPAYDAPPTDATRLAPHLLWLTYDNGVRVDALVRSGALEGDVRIPFDANDAFTLGTATNAGRRYTTFGLTRR